MASHVDQRKDRTQRGKARPLRPDGPIPLTSADEPASASQDYCPEEGNCIPDLVNSTSFIPGIRKGLLEAPPKRDLRLPVLMRAPKYTGEAGLIAHHWAKRVPRCFTSVEEMRLFQMAAYIVAEKGWYSIFAHTRAVVERDLLSDAERDFAKLEVKENIQLCSIKHVACLLFSTKVSFFEKGHHTGTPFLTGLVEFAFDLGEWCEVSFSNLRTLDSGRAKLLTETVRLSGNWVCTHGAFIAWKTFPQIEGASTTIPHLSSGLLEPLAKKMLERLDGSPAGTAPIFNACSILEAAATSRYAKYFVSTESQAAMDEREKIKRDQFSYHLESGWLIGKVKKSPLVLSDDFVSLISAFVHAYMPDSGLVHSRFLKRPAHVEGMPLYKLIQQDQTAPTDGM